jgi:DNA-binding LacI/PurR family transcriptional regulator
MEPALTTIAQPARQIGERVAIRLFKAIERGNQPNNEPVILPHKLVIRESVAAPRS